MLRHYTSRSAEMNDQPRITWLIDRMASRGRVRIGLLGRNLVVALWDKQVPLEGNDMQTLDDLASARRTLHLVPPLRDGGYTHLLGGKIGLLPGEAATLKAVLLGTPEGLRTRRQALLEMVAEVGRAEPAGTVAGETGIAHHAEATEAQIPHARRMLMDFDLAFPSVRSSM